MKQASKIHDISGHEVQVENLSANCVRPDPEVLEKKPRRKFTAAYKLRILEEFDACVNKGERGGSFTKRRSLPFQHMHMEPTT